MASDGLATLRGMFIVKVLCSDEECAEEFEVVVETLEEVDDVLCECDRGTVLLSVAEVAAGAEVIRLDFRRDPRPLAA